MPAIRLRFLTCAAALATVVSFGTGSAAGRTQIDWTPVGNAIGVPGKLQPAGLYKVSLPRSDLHVTLAGVRLNPAFALGSYLAFMRSGSGALLMGDLVLTQPEIEPVMSKLEQGGIEITALHNHLLGETPTVMYMHVMASGDPVKLAAAARRSSASRP